MMFVLITYRRSFSIVELPKPNFSVIDHGFGRHIWSGPPDAAAAWAKSRFIAEVSYTCIICSVKFSLLAFYWRMFKQSKICVLIYVLVAVVSAWGIAVVSPESLRHVCTLHFDPSLDSSHNLLMSASERILDTICANTARIGQLHMLRQRQPVLRWKLHPEHHYRCGTSHSAYAIHMATASPSSPKARSDQCLCPWCFCKFCT